MTDTATYERLQKDVNAVKNDIAALTDQITDALNSFAGDCHQAGAPRLQAGPRRCGIRFRRHVRARQRDDGRGAGRGKSSLEETLEDAITQRPLATVGIALGIGLLIGIAWRR